MMDGGMVQAVEDFVHAGYDTRRRRSSFASPMGWLQKLMRKLI